MKVQVLPYAVTTDVVEGVARVKDAGRSKERSA